MAFEALTEKFSKVIKKIKGESHLTEKNMDDMLKEVRIALLEADVNYKVVRDFVNGVKEKAIGEKVFDKLNPSEMVVKIVRDELVNLLGSDACELTYNKNKPTIILLVGLQGSGKTTTAGKLAYLMKNKLNKKVLLAACDVYRPAAIDQLDQIAKQINVPLINLGTKENPVNIALKAKEEAYNDHYDVLIIDTAGRLQIDEALMGELEELSSNFKMDETVLVIDAMMGQDAINVITGFNEKLKLTGTILTKLDGNTKGGVALSVRHLTHIPIKFVGDSEKMDGLREFYPDRMAERILDMGDILGIAEKVEGLISEDDAKNQMAKMRKGKYDLEDFLTNIKQIKKLGPLENILKMLPGARKMGLNNVNIDPKQLAHVEAIISSMTPEERHNPEILKASRKKRIAMGSGVSVEEVNRLLKQFESMKDMMKRFSNGNMKMPF